MKLANIKISPREGSKHPFYTFVLSRIDEAEMAFNGNKFGFTSDRKWTCDPQNCFETLRADIASKIKPKKASKSKVTISYPELDDEDSTNEA
jgi:hypothetical protein